MEELLRRHYAQGGKTQWIATFYSPPGAKAKDELRRILQMRPRPIGAQHFGATTDALMRRGKIDDALDTLKMLRDAGLLVGLCTHNHEVIDYAAERDWDVDFYQASLYRVKYDVRKPDRPVPNRPEDEYFEEDDRKAMLRTIAAVDKPCMVFKVLGANRHCRTDEDVQQAIRYTLDRIKPSDVILLGVWHKYKDQVGQDTDIVRQWKGPELH